MYCYTICCLLFFYLCYSYSSYCSDEFIDIYNKSDIIISKGQGNYEALSEEKGNIFFLLKAKCPMISRKLNVNLNEYIFKYGGIKQ